MTILKTVITWRNHSLQQQPDLTDLQESTLFDSNPITSNPAYDHPMNANAGYTYSMYRTSMSNPPRYLPAPLTCPAAVPLRKMQENEKRQEVLNQSSITNHVTKNQLQKLSKLIRRLPSELKNTIWEEMLRRSPALNADELKAFLLGDKVDGVADTPVVTRGRDFERLVRVNIIWGGDLADKWRDISKYHLLLTGRLGFFAASAQGRPVPNIVADSIRAVIIGDSVDYTPCKTVNFTICDRFKNLQYLEIGIGLLPIARPQYRKNIASSLEKLNLHNILKTAHKLKVIRTYYFLKSEWTLNVRNNRAVFEWFDAFQRAVETMCEWHDLRVRVIKKPIMLSTPDSQTQERDKW